MATKTVLKPAKTPAPANPLKPEKATAHEKPADGKPASRSATSLQYDGNDVGLSHADDRKFVWALARGLEILRSFKPGQGAMSNHELTVVTGLPKATVTRLTYTLTELGYLIFNRRLNKYEPAPGVLALGYPVLANLRIRQIAHDYMQKLANHANASVALASPDRISMIYVDAASSNALTTLLLDIGSRVDMATTAVGRAYLAVAGEAARETVFAGLAKRYGADWPDLKSRVLASIDEVRDRGFCVVDNEWKREVRAAGAPLISADGATVMAMNCGGPAFALDRQKLEQDFGPRLAHLCRTIAPMTGR